MTRQEFVELHRHQIAGLVLDAATAGRQGAELSVWLKLVMGKIDQQLGKMWNDLHPPTNGNGHEKNIPSIGKTDAGHGSPRAMAAAKPV